jgi:hypothetical protein
MTVDRLASADVLSLFRFSFLFLYIHLSHIQPSYANGESVFPMHEVQCLLYCRALQFVITDITGGTWPVRPLRT